MWTGLSAFSVICRLAEGVAVGAGFVFVGFAGVAAGFGGGIVWPSCCAKMVCVCATSINVAQSKTYFIATFVGAALRGRPSDRFLETGGRGGPPLQSL